MWPIGPLMHEHRLIERMIALLEGEAGRLRGGGALDAGFIAQAVDFVRTYADRCHHGKEEDILFRDLAARELPPELRTIMDELVAEHQRGRALVARLVAAAQRGEALAVAELLAELADFYPRHIAKEDKRFFFPCMDLFTGAEKDAMLAEFDEFDRRLIHEKYAALVQEREAAVRG